jgi:hypothetical protein
MNQIYTAGYHGHNPTQLESFVTQHGAVVADIRFVASSRIDGWSRKDLAQRLGSSYFHLPTLGNTNYNQPGPIAIANPEVGINIVKQWAAKKPIILLCGCADLTKCHRHTVSQMLARDGIQTQEMVWPTEGASAGKIKCISLWQPHASLMFLDPEWRKCVETRGWETHYRGPLAIHAAKTTKGLESIDYEAEIARALVHAKLLDYDFEEGMTRWHKLPLGALLGVVNLVDCQPTEKVRRTITPRERCFGDYSPERFGWLTEKASALPEPIPYRGAQRIFEIDASLVAEQLATLSED